MGRHFKKKALVKRVKKEEFVFKLADLNLDYVIKKLKGLQVKYGKS